MPASTRNVCLTVALHDKDPDVLVREVLATVHYSYACWAVEVGDSGYRHLQMFVYLRNATPYHWRFVPEIRRFLPQVTLYSPHHGEAMMGKRHDAMGYTCKGLRPKPVAGYRLYLDDPCEGWSEVGNRPRDFQGLSHMDAEEAKSLFKVDTRPPNCPGCGLEPTWLELDTRWQMNHCTLMCQRNKNRPVDYHADPGV